MQSTFENSSLVSLLLLVAVAFSMSARSAHGAIVLDAIDAMVLYDQTVDMPDGAPFSRYVNGSTYRAHALTTHGAYEFATWYHADAPAKHFIQKGEWWRGSSHRNRNWLETTSGSFLDPNSLPSLCLRVATERLCLNRLRLRLDKPNAFDLTSEPRRSLPPRVMDFRSRC